MAIPVITMAIPVIMMRRSALWPGSSVEVLVRMPWRTGPCALILAHGTTSAGWIGATLPASRAWLAPVVLLFAFLDPGNQLFDIGVVTPGRWAATYVMSKRPSSTPWHSQEDFP